MKMSASIAFALAKAFASVVPLSFAAPAFSQQADDTYVGIPGGSGLVEERIATQSDYQEMLKACEVTWIRGRFDKVRVLNNHLLYQSGINCTPQKNIEICQTVIFSPSSNVCYGVLLLGNELYRSSKGQYPLLKHKGVSSFYPFIVDNFDGSMLLIYEWTNKIRVTVE